MKKFILLLVLSLSLVGLVSAQWEVREQTDMLTDAREVFLSCKASVYEEALNTPVLIFRWTLDSEVLLDCFVAWGGYKMSEDDAMKIKFGDSPLLTIPIDGISTDYKSIFIIQPDGMLNRLKTMEKTEFVTIAARDQTGVMAVAKFQISNLNEVLGSLNLEP